jgi:hypothetical protein
MTALPYASPLQLSPAAPTPVRRRREPVPSQLLFRELNEEIAQRRPAREATLELVCECGRHSCTRAVLLTLVEYEAVRRFPTRFFVRNGHGSADGERLVETHEHYEVIEKTGPSALVAIRLDPRRRREPPNDAA